MLRWLIGVVGLRWALSITGALFGCISLIGLLFRPIDPRALALLDVQQRSPPAASSDARAAPEAAAKPAVPNNPSESSEPIDIELEMQAKPALQSLPHDTTAKEDEFKPSSTIEGEAGSQLAEQRDVHEKLLVDSSAACGHNKEKSVPAVAAHESKKSGSKLATSFAYFRHMPPLLCYPTYLLHAVHFAIAIATDITLVAVSLDSFLLKDLEIPKGWVYTLGTANSVGNLIGRFGSGLFVVMPALIANCRRQQQKHANPEAPPAAGQSQYSQASPAASTSCFATLQRILSVRVVYCAASGVVSICVLLLALVGLNGRGGALAGWEPCLACVYAVMGFAAGCIFSQFPVVLTELVGLQRLAAGHALFMFLQTPTSFLPFFCGLIKSIGGSWGLSYLLLFAIFCTMSVLNSVGLLFGTRVGRLCQLLRLCNRRSDE